MKLLFLLAFFITDTYGGLKTLGDPNFTCDPKVMAKSASVPNNVNQVRFADIRVIGALGDSLTAGNGAGAPHSDPLAIILQYRGLAFHGGGQLELEEQITIPNILKKFNPDLKGHAIGTGSENVWEVARLNGGRSGSRSLAGGDNLGVQAMSLIQKIRAHPDIDIENDWKLINIFIGGNDVCAWCSDPYSNGTHAPWGYKVGIENATRLLKEHLPRTIVSVTGMMHMDLLRKIDKGQQLCSTFHVFECHCEPDNVTDHDLYNISVSYQLVTQQLQDSGQFEANDFTFVVQPFFEGILTPPLFPNGTVDHLFFAPDCFHFSKFGHAVVAHNLWNNLVEPVGSKNRQGNLSISEPNLKCPPQSCPFFQTVKNSKNCAGYWTPSELDV